MNLAALTSAINSGFGQCTKICALSIYKFILTLPTIELMEDVLRNHEELDSWFYEVKKWSSDDYCDTRKVWLEIYGVPPHGWSWENFKNIAQLWGSLICLGKSILRTDTFEVMRVLIVTDIFRRIEQEILLSLADRGYRVWIKEIGSTVQVVHLN